MTAYFDIPLNSFKTRQGVISMPILYYNTASVFANFVVDSKRATELLPADLEPVTVAPGKTLATIAFFQYVDSSVGPYNEMGLAIAAHPSKRRGFKDSASWHPGKSALPGMYVVDLPVTTEVANAAGREIWGYPKIVVPIDFLLRGNEVACTVRDADGSGILCRLEGRSGRSVQLAAPNLMTFTCLDGKLVRTVIDMRGRVNNAGAGSVRLDCGSCDHHLSRHLRQLNLQNAKPVLVQYGLGLRAILPAGVVVE